VNILSPDEPHLGEDHILQAVIDDTDLSTLQQQHLAECPRCQSHRERLENELTHLGQLAEHYAPEPLRRINVTDDKIRSPLSIRGFAFSAAAVAAVIIVVWATFLIRSQQQGRIGNLAQDMVEAERLMTEINVYLDIVGETNLDLDEDFIDFLIPTNEGVPRISALAKKGSILC
jgi:hypothetical protein